MNAATLPAKHQMSSGLHGSNSKLITTNIKQESMPEDSKPLQIFYRDTSIQMTDEDSKFGVKTETESDNGLDGKGPGETQVKKEEVEQKKDGDVDSPSVDIYINNVVCAYSVRCHLNLRRIGQFGSNVEYRREYGKVNMRFRNPSATATIWSSGRITITGNDSEQHAKQTARKCARVLQKMGFNVRFSQYKVVNVLGTCSMPFGIRIRDFSERYPEKASYEPELHPAVTYKLYNPRATLKIFSTGSITVTAPAVDNINAAIQHIYPLVEVHKMPLTEATIQKRLAKKRKLGMLDEEDEENTDDEFANEGAGEDEEDSDDYSSGDSS